MPSLPTGRRSAETPHRPPPRRLRRRSAPSAPAAYAVARGRRAPRRRCRRARPCSTAGLGYVAPPSSLLRPAILRSPTPSPGGSPTSTPFLAHAASAPRRQPLLRGSRQLPWLAFSLARGGTSPSRPSRLGSSLQLSAAARSSLPVLNLKVVLSSLLYLDADKLTDSL